MNFKIEFYPDKNYYKEAYDEMLSTNFLKKWQPLFGIFFVILGYLSNSINKNENLNLPTLMILGYGIYEFFSYFLLKKKWMNDRLKSKVFEKKMELEFYEDYFISFGPFSEGKLNWNGLKQILKTKKGIILRLETGMSIYLSDKIFNTKNEIDFIISKRK